MISKGSEKGRNNIVESGCENRIGKHGLKRNEEKTPTAITAVVVIADAAMERVATISLSGVPTSALVISFAFIMQGIFMFIRLPVINAR